MTDLLNTREAHRCKREIIGYIKAEARSEAMWGGPNAKKLKEINLDKSNALVIMATVLIVNAKDIGIIELNGTKHMVTRVYNKDGSFSGIWQILPSPSDRREDNMLRQIIYNICYDNPKGIFRCMSGRG